MSSSLVLFSIIVTFISAGYAYYYYKYSRYLRGYPGPPIWYLWVYSVFFGILNDWLQILQELHKKYGKTLKLQVSFLPPRIVTCDPKLVESLLGSTKILHKATNYDFLKPWLGTGLLTSEPAKWKKHRRILTPAFHFQILENFAENFDAYSNILVEKLESEVGRSSFDVCPYVTLCTLDIICKTSMGTHIGAQNHNTSKYVTSVAEISRLLVARGLNVLSFSNFLYSKTKKYREEQEALEVLHGYTNGVIDSRKRYLNNGESGKTGRNGESVIGMKERNTFLDTLLKYKLERGSMTDEEIREEVDTFMFEGHDTTSAGVSFTLYCLASNPEVQEKTFAEIRSIFGDEERLATHKDLNDMKYLEMVIKESLRLYPPVSMFSRKLTEATEFGGKVLPKNLSITVFAYGMHRDPEVFPDPERFEPERFNLENQARRSPYAYVPFSAGPRNCIGQKFAMLEMKAVISKILRKFQLLPAIPGHRLVLVPEMILRSTTGVHIRLEKRRKS